MKKSNLTEKKYWNSQWRKFDIKKIKKEYYLFDLFKKYLPFDKNKKCIEIGCAPGNFLIAFNKNFGYIPYGVDFSDEIIKTQKNFEYNDVSNFKLIKEDFSRFESNEKFFVVCSFGFIEHFKQPEKQIEKMVSLLETDGYLILGLPNLRYGQYIIHKMFNEKEMLAKHNLDIMNLENIEKIMKKHNIKKVYSNYYKLFEYSFSNKERGKILFNLFLVFTSKIINVITNKLDLNTTFKSKYISPYIIYVGKSQI